MSNSNEMALENNDISSKGLNRRNLYAFSIGTFGRDMACMGLFTAQLLNYVYFTKGLTTEQLAALTIIMAVIRVFDALNDPLMGNLIDATRSKWGKFKPWIFAGMIGTAAVIIASFTNNLTGWAYVGFFGAMYFLWSIFFTMNDISYWGMLPALARSPKDRNKISSLTALSATLGGGLAGIVLPILTTGELALGGSAIKAYGLLSVIMVAVFVIIQSITIFGVKNKDMPTPQPAEKVSLKLVFQTFLKNDQLKWISVIFLFTQLLPGTAMTMYIYFQFGYNGTLTTLFYVFNAISTLVMYIFYPKFAKHFTRTQLLTFATISAFIGYGLMLLFGLVIPKGAFSFTIPFFNATVTLQFFLIAVANLFTGFTCTTFYLVLMICIANTVEYNDLKFGKRDEGIIFATRAFLVQLGTALSTFGVMLFYIIIGINNSTDKIADLEQAANLGQITSDAKLDQIADVIDSVPNLQTTGLLLLITILPVILFVIAFIIYKKKYKITEGYFNSLVEDLEKRDAGLALESAAEDTAVETLFVENTVNEDIGSDAKLDSESAVIE